MITKTIKLDENYSFLFRKFDGGKEIYLVDDVVKSQRLIAFLTEDLKWEKTSYDFFDVLGVKYHSALMNNIFKPLEDPHETPVNEKFNCFKRRFNIKINRTINKIKHI